MPASDDHTQTELLRKFQAATSGMELSDLRQFAGDLTAIAGRAALTPTRPELRRPPLLEPATYRIRVDLDHAKPPIWRRLDLRSDLTLDVVHEALQTAFDWTDSHLHRFALGGHAFDWTSQLFLCPFDIAEGETEEDGEIPASEVRLDETLQEPGDVLNYVYDYGDNWELTLRLEQVLPAPRGSPSATAVAGSRAAPPEDSGGRAALEDMAEIVDDPEHFDLDEFSEAFRAPYFTLRDDGVDHRLVDIVSRMRHTQHGGDLVERAIRLVTVRDKPDQDELHAALAPYRWFLDRARGGGIALTAAGYLKPDDVRAASAILPTMRDWIGENNREANAVPLLDFRQSLQAFGLLRKHKGILLLTRAGAIAQREPERLWAHLAERLIPARGGEFETVATLLVLLYVATSPERPFLHPHVTGILTEFGWRRPDGRPFEGYELTRLAVFDILANLSEAVGQVDAKGVSPMAAALARAALVRAEG